MQINYSWILKKLIFLLWVHLLCFFTELNSSFIISLFKVTQDLIWKYFYLSADRTFSRVKLFVKLADEMLMIEVFFFILYIDSFRKLEDIVLEEVIKVMRLDLFSVFLKEKFGSYKVAAILKRIREDFNFMLIQVMYIILIFEQLCQLIHT